MFYALNDSRRQLGHNTPFTHKTACFTRKTICFMRKTKILPYFNVLFYAVKPIVLRVMTSVLSVKHYINDPFGHKLQTTLISVTTFYA